MLDPHGPVPPHCPLAAEDPTRARSSRSEARAHGTPSQTPARGNLANCCDGQGREIGQSVPPDPGRDRRRSGPVSGLVLVGLPGSQAAWPHDRTRCFARPQRQLEAASAQGTHRTQPTLVLGHQLPDDPPEGAVPLPVPAVGRVVPQDHPVANRLVTDRRGIPMASGGWIGRSEHPRSA